MELQVFLHFSLLLLETQTKLLCLQDFCAYLPPLTGATHFPPPQSLKGRTNYCKWDFIQSTQGTSP